MAAHYSEADEKGNFKVTYDTPEEDPAYKQDGEAIEVSDVLDLLHAKAKARLSSGTVYEIRGREEHATKFGLAWYTVYEMQAWPLEAAIPYPGRHNPLGGYMYLGRFKT
jgi:hypothetical protein